MKVKRRNEEPAVERRTEEPMIAFVSRSPQPRWIRVAPGLFGLVSNPEAIDRVPPAEDET